MRNNHHIVIAIDIKYEPLNPVVAGTGGQQQGRAK